MPPTAVCEITETHASKAAKFASQEPCEKVAAVEQLVAEIDGSMIPMVRIEVGNGQETTDKRRLRKTEWKEARLSVVQVQGCVSSRYGVSFGSTGEAGLALFRTAQQAGFGTGSSSLTSHQFQLHPVIIGRLTVRSFFCFLFRGLGRNQN